MPTIADIEEDLFTVSSGAARTIYSLTQIKLEDSGAWRLQVFIAWKGNCYKYLVGKIWV